MQNECQSFRESERKKDRTLRTSTSVIKFVEECRVPPVIPHLDISNKENDPFISILFAFDLNSNVTRCEQLSLSPGYTTKERERERKSEERTEQMTGKRSGSGTKEAVILTREDQEGRQLGTEERRRDRKYKEERERIKGSIRGVREDLFFILTTTRGPRVH